MDFSYSEEQTLLSNSLRKLLEDSYDADKRRKIAASERGFSDEAWTRYAELGLLGLPLPESAGGFGGTAIDTMIASVELGRALALEPFVATVVMGAGAIRLAGSPEQQEAMLPAVAEGKLKLAAALGEPQARFDLDDVSTTAAKAGADYVLNGRKAVVLGGDSADKLVVSARTSGGATDRAGLSLFVVEASAAGVVRRGYQLVDGRGAAEVTLSDVKVPQSARLGAEGGAWPVIEQVSDLAISALLGEAIGAWERINELTLEYLKTRQQFGRTIGQFQVLQHRMVDLTLEYEHAKSLVYLAAMEADSTAASQRGRAIAAAKFFVDDKGRQCGEHAIQMHGGIGMTQEYVLSDYVKRLAMISHTLGDSDHHLARFARASTGKA
ncbi:MAG: acyl-CoA dehydrogenase family protein [Hyphomicrobiaceae bacterium]